MSTTVPAALIERVIRPAVRALKAYSVPSAEGLIKLDAMENPYTLPPELIDRWLERLRQVQLNRYPDPEAAELKSRLRRYLELPAGLDLMLGNGSDELIQILAMAVTGRGSHLLAPEPSFAMYPLIARAAGLEYLGVPLREGDFSLDLGRMLSAFEEHRPLLSFIASPNNPTGNLFPEAEVEALIEASPGLVVIDEAYHAFSGCTLLGTLERFPNVLLLRTLSKVGLAGLRLGVLIGRREWLAELDKLRLPYNINVLSQVSATFLLEHAEVFERQAQAIRRERGTLLEALRSLETVQVWPSQANFLLLRVPDATAVYQRLKQRGVLVKCLHGAHPQLENCLRVTVSTPAENREFLGALRHALAAA